MGQSAEFMVYFCALVLMGTCREQQVYDDGTDGTIYMNPLEITVNTMVSTVDFC